MILFAFVAAGDGDRRLLLAVLDGRVTAYSKQATAKFELGLS
jgi:hypothetical protein